MKALTHVVFAEACWFGTCACWGLDQTTGAAIAAGVAALVPDVDYPKSWPGYLAGDLSRWLNEKTGHRAFFHSLIALAAVALVVYLVAVNTGLISLVVWGAFLVGYASHIFADMMTLSGVQLFFPSKAWCVFPGRDEYRILSGGKSERVFIGVALACALLLYPVAERGLSGLIAGMGTPSRQYAQVARVIDGDTVEIEIMGGAKPVRLSGVDTPEVVHPDEPIDCYGPEASAFAKDQLTGQTVMLELPSIGDTEDDYGRLLGYIYLQDVAQAADGKPDPLDSFNAELMRRGFAEDSGFPHAADRGFDRLLDEAQAEERGLWGAC